MNEGLEFYKKVILPYRLRAERAEALCEVQSKLIKSFSAEICKEGK